MRARQIFLLLTLTSILLAPARALGHGGESYAKLRQELAAASPGLRQAVSRARGAHRKAAVQRLRDALLGRIDRLHSRWLGTRWGLGAPQTRAPGEGKINCGMFVARVLRDAGFRLDIWKFNRQAASDAIRSLTPAGAIRRFHDAPMKKFLARVRKMGPGIYLIGLDFHIGFLRQTEKDLRFVHASYVDKVVVDEPAAAAVPIVTSRYRVVGKLLGERMLEAWLANRRIKVLGKR